MAAAIGSVQRHHGDAIQIAIGDVELLLVRRERHAVGVRALVRCQPGRHRRRGHDYRDGREYRVRPGVDYVHRIRLVRRDVQKRLGRVQRHLVGLALHWDPGRDGRRRAQLHYHDLAVANAGYIRCRARSVTLHNHPERIFAARNARHGGVALAGAQVQFRQLRPVAEASGEHRDRVVVVICHHQRLAIARDGHAGGARTHAHLAVYRDGAVRRQVKANAQAIVAQGQRRTLRLPPGSGGAPGKNVDIVAGAAGHVERRAGWIEDNPVVAIGDLDYLRLDRRLLGNVVDEHILVRVRRVPRVRRRRDAQRVDAVEPAGQNQHGLPIRTYHRGGRLTGQPVWPVGQIGVQHIEPGTLGRQRRNLLAHIGQVLDRDAGLRMGRRGRDDQRQRQTSR